eukprot:m.168337 g.168337  ORF g.168337 m.168337 type:complete len:308 (+) comp17213_c0_seq3:1315-2238(+)
MRKSENKDKTHTNEQVVYKSGTEWSMYFRMVEKPMFLMRWLYMNVGMMVRVTEGGASWMSWIMSLSFIATTFWPLTSTRLWWMSRPLRAAELSATSAEISPLLRVKPMWLKRSLTVVMVRSNGRSRTIKETLPAALRRAFMDLSEVHPATVAPLICRIWSPKRKPARAAGLPAQTKATKTPLSTALSATPSLPSAPFSRTASWTPCWMAARAMPRSPGFVMTAMRLSVVCAGVMRAAMSWPMYWTREAWLMSRPPYSTSSSRPSPLYRPAEAVPGAGGTPRMAWAAWCDAVTAALACWSTVKSSSDG